MLRTLLFIFGSMSIGYIAYTIIYYKQSHCIVKFRFGVIADDTLLVILAIVGFILSLFK